MTLEPDGTAAACKAARSGFDSHRRLFECTYKQGLTSLGQRLAVPSINGWRRVFRTWNLTKAMLNPPPRLAQWKEHQTDNLAVTGSTPVPTTAGCKPAKARERSHEPEGGGRSFGSPRAVALALARQRRKRQHEPRLCSAWIPRLRTQRFTVMKVPRRGTGYGSRRTVRRSGRTTLRARLLKRHSASQHGTDDRLRRPRAFLPNSCEPRSQFDRLKLPQVNERSIQTEKRFNHVPLQASQDP